MMSAPEDQRSYLPGRSAYPPVAVRVHVSDRSAAIPAVLRSGSILGSRLTVDAVPTTRGGPHPSPAR